MLTKRNTRRQIVEDRNRALALVREGLAKLAEADAAFKRAAMDHYSLFGGLQGPDRVNACDPKYAERVVEKIRRRLDGRIWEHLLEVSGLRALMDAEAVEDYREQLDEPPEVSEETITATFSTSACTATATSTSVSCVTTCWRKPTAWWPSITSRPCRTTGKGRNASAGRHR